MELIKEIKFKYKKQLSVNQIRNAQATWQKTKLKKSHIPRYLNIIEDNFEEGFKFPDKVYIEVIKRSRHDLDGIALKYFWDKLTELGYWEDDNPKFVPKYSVEQNMNLKPDSYIIRFWDYSEETDSEFFMSEYFKEY